MKKKLDKVQFIFKILFISIVILFNLWMLVSIQSLKVSISIFIFSIFVILSYLFHERLNKKYMEEIFIQLSDMLATIIDMREDEVFSTIEDSLFSKLQHQTIKLTTILKNKNKDIENERNEIKSLISDISHQLKTPLTNLKMYGEFLQDENLSEEERKEFTKVIIVSLNRMSFLVESMIKMSRLESGVISLKPQINSLNETILMAIGQVQKKARLKNIVIELNEIDKINIVHDKNWVYEGFFNILENAVKYTGQQGVIEITLRKYEMFARVDIKDNGSGISEEEIPKIFKRFYRGTNASDVEGIGIGLYLTREIIKKHGGYIKVTSSNKGTNFSVFLPNNIRFCSKAL